jgi:hypothetical protein
MRWWRQCGRVVEPHSLGLLSSVPWGAVNHTSRRLLQCAVSPLQSVNGTQSGSNVSQVR